MSKTQFLTQLAEGQKQMEMQLQATEDTKLTSMIRSVLERRRLQAVYTIYKAGEFITQALPLDDFKAWLDGDPSGLGLRREQGDFRLDSIYNYKTDELVASLLDLGAGFCVLFAYDEDKSLDDILTIIDSYEQSTD